MLSAWLWVMVSAPPLVSVDASALDDTRKDVRAVQQLHGKVAIRLVESGFHVVGVGLPADVVLTMTRAGAQIEITAIGIGDAQVTLPYAPGDAVSVLAVVQQAALLTAKIAPAKSAQPSSVAAVILVNDPDQEAVVLLEALVVSLADAGLVISSAPPAGEAAVCVVVQPSHISVTLIVPGSSCAPVELVAGDNPRTKLVARDADDVVNETMQAAMAVLGEFVRAPQPETAAGVTRMELGAGIGAVVRGPADPAVMFTFGLLRDHGPGARISIAGLYSRQPPLSVFETVLVGEALYRLRIGARLRLGAGVGAGVLLHAYRFGDRRGADLDWTFTLPFDAVWILNRSMDLGVAASIGLAGGDRRHVVGEATLWHRQPWRLGLLAGINYRL